MSKYLPLWTDRFPTSEQQYDLGWIMGSCEEDPRHSLLPLRFYGRGIVFPDTFYESYTVNHFYPQMSGWHWLQTEIIPADFFFAKTLYEKAAEQIFMKYPDLSGISFSRMTNDGVYPINWTVPYSVLLEDLQNAIRNIYNSGFSIDEHIDAEETLDQLSNTHTVRISGVLIGPAREISTWYYKCKPENYLTRKLKKQFRLPLEDCLAFYRVFSEDELTLGNQSRKYTENEKQFAREFYSADSNDFAALIEHVKNGFDLNTMGRRGETAFSRFCDSCGEYIDYDKLDTLLALGANPALYGCSFDAVESPLWKACLCHDITLVEYFLSKGVNPAINTDTFSAFGEFLIHRLERWNDEAEFDQYKRLIELVKHYSSD